MQETFGTTRKKFANMVASMIENYWRHRIYLTPVWAIGVVSNWMVIFVILKIKEMRNSTNIFLMNLAIADLIYLLIWGTALLIRETHFLELMNKSELICKALPFINGTSFVASVLTILAIAFERYYAICQPLKTRYICTKSRAHRTILIMWAVAALASSPRLFVWSYHKESCQYRPYYYQPNNQFQSQSLLNFYHFFIISTLTFFLMPIVILTVIFVIIFWRLNVTVAPDVNTATIRHRRHVIKMLATVILVFFVCHLPNRVFVILTFTFPRESILMLRRMTYRHLAFFCGVLTVVHSAVNPILYNLMSKNFRKGFKKVFCDIFNGLLKRCR